MTKKKLTYNEALAEIEEILQAVENNELEIDELSQKIKRVSYLFRFCRDKLTQTEEEVEKILQEITKDLT